MGGGQAAKERRKIERMKKFEEETQTLNSIPKSSEINTTTNTDTDTVSAKEDRSITQKDRKQGNNRLEYRKMKQKAPQKKKKKKMSKPKHLKRKLENASSQNEKQVILEQMKIMENVKGKVNKNTESSSDEKQQEGGENYTETEEVFDDMEEEVEDFPRDYNEDDRVSSNETSVVVDEIEANKEEDTSKEDAEVGHNAADSDIGDSDIGDSDSDILNSAEINKRQRGKKRKNRTEEDEKLKQIAQKVKDEKEEAKKKQLEAEQASAAKKTPKSEDKRRCIGRKPVTDFKKGERYPGKIVYMKEFGAFIDIMCHSDAFCHISRFGKEEIKRKEGDLVSIHVLKVEKKKKRITVSLEPDEVVNEHKENMKKKKAEVMEKKKEEKEQFSKKQQQSSSSTADVYNSNSAKNEERNDNNALPKESSELTPADLKRARKLARRAERRAAHAPSTQ